MVHLHCYSYKSQKLTNYYNYRKRRDSGADKEVEIPYKMSEKTTTTIQQKNKFKSFKNSR